MPKFPTFYFYIKELLITLVENRADLTMESSNIRN